MILQIEVPQGIQVYSTHHFLKIGLGSLTFSKSKLSNDSHGQSSGVLKCITCMSLISSLLLVL